jgi:hypothetical protein
VPREVELEGLDGPEMGAHGYPDFNLVRHDPAEAHAAPVKAPVAPYPAKV